MNNWSSAEGTEVSKQDYQYHEQLPQHQPSPCRMTWKLPHRQSCCGQLVHTNVHLPWVPWCLLCWVAVCSWVVDHSMMLLVSACLHPCRDLISAWPLLSQSVLWLQLVSWPRTSNPLICWCDNVARFPLIGAAARHYVPALMRCKNLVFSTEPRDWLGSTSARWPILHRVGRKTLNQSIASSVHNYVRHNVLLVFRINMICFLIFWCNRQL